MNANANGQAPSTNNLMPCANCQQAIAVSLPVIRIQNYPEISLILFSHPKLEKCPQCGSTFVVSIAGFNQQGGLEFKLSELKTNQSAIVPPTPQQTMAVNKEKLPS